MTFLRTATLLTIGLLAPALGLLALPTASAWDPWPCTVDTTWHSGYVSCTRVAWDVCEPFAPWIYCADIHVVGCTADNTSPYLTCWAL